MRLGPDVEPQRDGTLAGLAGFQIVDDERRLRIASDFVYRNNIVNNGNYVRTAQGGASAAADAGGRGSQPSAPTRPHAPTEYQVVGSYFANNRRLVRP